MTRPVYETATDRSAEASVIQTVAIKWKCDVAKNPRAYPLDWSAYRNGELTAWGEVKCRNNHSTKYPTLMLSAHKWAYGKIMAADAGVPFVIFVKWSDGIFWHKAGSCEVKHGHGGRKDRNDWQDLEPVVFIPTKEFKRL